MKIVNVSKLYGLCGPRGGTKINFDWVLEATEENKERILHEIIKKAYGGTKHEKHI